MIVGMKRVSIVMRTQEKTNSLRELRKVGVVHVDPVEVQNETISELNERHVEFEKIISVLTEKSSKGKEKTGQAVLSPDEFEPCHERIVTLLELEEECRESLAQLRKDKDFLTPYGQVEISDLRLLRDNGYQLFFYWLENKVFAKLQTPYLLISSDKKQSLIATVSSPLPSEFGAEQVHFPIHSLNETDALITAEEEKLASLNREIIENSYLIPSYVHYAKVILQEQEFEKVQEGMEESSGIISWVSGYLPEDRIDDFKKFAQKEKIGYSLSEPDEEDNPPTKVHNNRVVSIISPVFDLLGTVPGYREYDISMWFLMFFSVFFAMIIGDGAYGTILFGVTVALHVKTKKANNGIILMYVMSTASMIWGALTGAWFGSAWIIEHVGLLNALVIPQISAYPELFGLEATTAQSTVMQLCFIIGTLQLSLACVMNVHRKIGKKDISAVADFGWLIMIDALYFLVLLLVIQTPVNLTVIAGVVLSGLLLIIVFGAQGPGIPFGKGLLGGLAALFTTFLDSISTFGNVISYIRLFAVGMASLAISQSFNSMAGMMMHGFAIPAGVLVLLLGHSLNLVMALLSVVVHGVRLNLLEFSGQLGMEWTGYAYSPFKETVEPTSHTL